MNPKGMLVANFATLEHCTIALQLLRQHGWQVYLRQVNIARSTDIAGATRFAPLNPVTILQAIARE
ncbi:MAG: hypothetical protein HC925_07875 [Coleofasciculaceae cyanobacterium SM2_3_26]|nr:hypothetical protein [Coleofasciculaceae cyanobacterium SM2_3_26]